MLTLLAESKTMLSSQQAIPHQDFLTRKPLFEEEADMEMDFIKSLSVNEISEILGISGALATKTLSFAYEFPNKSLGYCSLSAFTGEAYKGLDQNSLSDAAKKRAAENLRIISSLYGYLRPLDIIKPYRLEFNKQIYEGRNNAIKTYRQKITVEFVKEIKSRNIKDIIDLLPADADLMIDWKISRAFAKVHKVVFKSIMPDGSLKTPLAKTLKEHRGKMARFIFENNIQSFEDLCKSESSDFLFSPADSKPLLPVFIIAP